jgi:hypothetical protein
MAGRTFKSTRRACNLSDNRNLARHCVLCVGQRWSISRIICSASNRIGDRCHVGIWAHLHRIIAEPTLSPGDVQIVPEVLRKTATYHFFEHVWTIMSLSAGPVICMEFLHRTGHPSPKPLSCRRSKVRLMRVVITTLK